MVSAKQVLLVAILSATLVVGVLAGWGYAIGVLLVAALGYSVMHVMGVGMEATFALELGALWGRPRGREPLEPQGWRTQALTLR